MHELIALHGPAGSGKSHAANILVEEFGYIRVKFAGPLKAMLGTLLSYAGVIPSEYPRFIEGDLKEVPLPSFGNKTARHLMVTLGTEWGRNHVHPDLWVNLALQPVLDHLAAGRRVVLDDCRFNNEAMEVIKLGGWVARIEPAWPEWTDQQRRKYAGKSLHPSEFVLHPGVTTHVIPNVGEPIQYRADIIEKLELYA